MQNYAMRLFDPSVDTQIAVADDRCRAGWLEQCMAVAG